MFKKGLISIIKRPDNLVIASNVLLGAIVRYLYILKYPVQPRDSYTYVEIIRNWEATGIIEDGVGIIPLGLWIPKIVSKCLSQDVMRCGIMINLFLGLCIIVVISQIGALIFREKKAVFVIGLIASTHPTLVRFSCEFLRENSYIFFTTLSILYYIKFIKRRKLFYVVSTSIAAAMSFACRLEGLELLVIFLVLIFTECITSKQGLRKTIASVSAFIVTYALSLVVLLAIMDVKDNNRESILKKMKIRTIERIK